jgi:predicted GNAT superfamily acetyltransferase
MTGSRTISGIEVKHCSTLDEFERCVEIEHVTWGAPLSVPSAIFVVAHHTGGQVLGAFDGDKIVGFTLALAGFRGKLIFLHSHMTAVLPEYRNCGIGRALKLFQREDALARGIGLIEWTFDPLEIKNAYLNLNRLGAIARRLIPNAYGVTNSEIHGTIPTDRLVAEWWIDAERVHSVLALNSSEGPTAGERVTLPSDISEIRAKDPASASRAQTAVRTQMLSAFSRGYAAVGIKSRGATTDYILRPVGKIAGLDLSATVRR